MTSNPTFKFFLDVNLTNFIFCCIVAVFSNIGWALIMFATVGILIGLIGFSAFRKNEYYAYYNLGFTKAALIKKVAIYNAIITATLLLILMLI